MVRKKLLRKLFLTTLVLFIMITVYSVPMTKKENVLRTNFEIEDITSIHTDSIYLKNKNDYFVKSEIFIDSEEIIEKVEKIIHYLTIDTHPLQDGLKGYIPKNVKLLKVEKELKEIKLYFSKELLDIHDFEKIVEGIVYSLTEQKEIKEVSFYIEDSPLEQYQKVTRKIGINKEYSFTNRKNLDKVVFYYLDDTGNYYVPVTKYMDNTEEKIEVILEELKKTKKDLISLENIHTKLLDYQEEGNVFFLNFNNELMDENKEAMSKLLQSIAYSIFDNYQVEAVLFEIEDKKFAQIFKE